MKKAQILLLESDKNTIKWLIQFAPICEKIFRSRLKMYLQVWNVDLFTQLCYLCLYCRCFCRFFYLNFFFFAGLVEMCVTHIPSPIDNARRKVENIYSGPLTNSVLAENMFNCDPEVIINRILARCPP